MPGMKNGWGIVVNEAHQESEEGPTYMSMVELNADVVGYIDCSNHIKCCPLLVPVMG